MTFIVVLVTLLIERFFDWSHLRKWSWFGGCERFAMQKIPGASPYLVLAGSILPLLVVVFLMEHLLVNALYGFLLLVIQTIVMLYCYGPQNLWADSFAAINAVTKEDVTTASTWLKSTFNVSIQEKPEALHRQLLNHIFISANQRVFAVVFWYGILGLPGALLYRLVNVTVTQSSSPEIGSAARTVEMVLDWLPVRILTFIFALGGNFTRVINAWRQRVMLGLDGNDLLLTECGLAAITSDTEKLAQDGSLEKSAVSLLDRSFIIVLVVVMVLVFIL